MFFVLKKHFHGQMLVHNCLHIYRFKQFVLRYFFYLPPFHFDFQESWYVDQNCSQRYRNDVIQNSIGSRVKLMIKVRGANSHVSFNCYKSDKFSETILNFRLGSNISLTIYIYESIYQESNLKKEIRFMNNFVCSLLS